MRGLERRLLPKLRILRVAQPVNHRKYNPRHFDAAMNHSQYSRFFDANELILGVAKHTSTSGRSLTQAFGDRGTCGGRGRRNDRASAGASSLPRAGAPSGAGSVRVQLQTRSRVPTFYAFNGTAEGIRRPSALYFLHFRHPMRTPFPLEEVEVAGTL